MTNGQSENERQLRVFEDRSEYHARDGGVSIFKEGVTTPDTRKRTKQIKESLDEGFLDGRIANLKSGELEPNADKVSEVAQSSLRGLAEGMTSEVGRALVGLTVMQLSIKTICPEQNVRLHKGGASRAAFSWEEGISMRTLDKNFVTPVLRRHDLVRLNADGFMMTRSLAENYPYSLLYKAKMRGAREEWLQFVEEIEQGNTDPDESLNFFLSLLINQADELVELSEALVNAFEQNIEKITSLQVALMLMKSHAAASTYAARLMEVSMHALAQACIGTGALGELTLKPLSQMRSANKKHGNIGDIEYLEFGEIVESWDAKFGKGYLREEIEEAAEKIAEHEMVELVGFVTDSDIERTREIEGRIGELETSRGVRFSILSYSDWVNLQFEKCVSESFSTEEELSREWCRAYVESLAQKRRDAAPIDEPCLQWVESLTLQIQNLPD